MHKITLHIITLTEVDLTPRLINTEGEVLSEGCIVHVVTGASIGRAYRYEGVYAYGKTHRIKVTRKATHGQFRSVEWLHPTQVGCKVHCPRTRKQRCVDVVAHTWSKIDDWFMAGLVALIPLAMFEHFHLASKITEVISLGMASRGH